MTPDERRDILVVLHWSDKPVPLKDEHRLRLPADASIADLLRELERESPAMCAEIRERILRSAGRVLAYGKGGERLTSLTEQLAAGGPIVFPVEDETRSMTAPIAEPNPHP